MGLWSRSPIRPSIGKPSAIARMMNAAIVPSPKHVSCTCLECGTHLICDAEISSCRQAQATGARLLLERAVLEESLILWDSGFHWSTAIFQVRAGYGHVLGCLKSNVLLKACD